MNLYVDIPQTGIDLNTYPNIAVDKTKNNSAATVKMVKDLETKLSPYTTNNVYREIFEEFYDLRWLAIVFTNNPSYVAYVTERNVVTLSLRFCSRDSPLRLLI